MQYQFLKQLIEQVENYENTVSNNKSLNMTDFAQWILTETSTLSDVKEASEKPIFTEGGQPPDHIGELIGLMYRYARNYSKKALEKTPLQTALGFFEQAIDRDPEFGLALAHASNAHINMYLTSEADHPDVSRQKAYDLAKRAERLGTNDAEVLAFAAYSLFQCGADMAIVDALITRALEMNPGSSVVRYNSGWIYAFACRPEAALKEFEMGLRLDPRSPWRMALTLGQGWSLFHLRRFDEALPLLYKSIETAQPEATRKVIAACYGHMGRYEEAKSVLDGIPQDDSPRATLWLSLYRDRSLRTIIDEGLALAAVGRGAR